MNTRFALCLLCAVILAFANTLETSAQSFIVRAPRLFAPANQSVQPSFGFPMRQPPLVRLEWDDAALPATPTAQYEVQIGYDNDFTIQPIISYFTKSSPDSLPFRLMPFISADVTLYWRVRATDRSSVGPWSEVRNFRQLKPNVDIPIITRKIQNIPIGPILSSSGMIKTEDRLEFNNLYRASNFNCLDNPCFLPISNYVNWGYLPSTSASVRIDYCDPRFQCRPSLYYAVDPRIPTVLQNCLQAPFTVVFKSVYGASVASSFFIFPEDSAAIARQPPLLRGFEYNPVRITTRTTSPLPLVLPSQTDEFRFGDTFVNATSSSQVIFFDGTFPLPSVSSASVSRILAGKKVLLTAPTSFQIKTDADTEWRSSLLIPLDSLGRYSLPVAVRFTPKKVGQIIEFMKIEVAEEVCNYPQILTLTGMSLPPASRPTARQDGITVFQPLETIPLGATIVSITPNPVQGAGTITIDQKSSGTIKVEIFNSLNQMVKSVAEGRYDAGRHDIRFDASNLPNGFYTCTVQSSTGTDFRGIMIQR